MQDEVKRYLLDRENENSGNSKLAVEKYEEYIKLLLEKEIDEVKEKYASTIKKILNVGKEKGIVTEEQCDELNDYLQKIVNNIIIMDVEKKENLQNDDKGER